MRAIDNDCNLMLVIELNFTKIEFEYYLRFSALLMHLKYNILFYLSILFTNKEINLKNE